MAQSLFDAIAGGMSNIENQSAIQSILEAQGVTEANTTQVEDDDVFQCGKCKKQFTSLSLFVSHKQGRCTPAMQRATFQPSVIAAAVPQQIHRPTISQQSLASYNTVPQSPLTQLTHNMVLTDDQMLTYDLGQTVQNGILQGSTLHLTGNTVQATGPFLSQVTQLAPRTSYNNVTILSPIQSSTSLAPSQGSAFTSTVVSNMQPIAQGPPQHITIATALPDKPATLQHIIKPSPTKAGRKSAQATALINDYCDVQTRHVSTIVGSVMTEDNKKKLVCNYCSKVFYKNFDLQQHVRSHTGEKPFQCVVCGRAFAQKSNVKKHMATHKVWPAGAGTSLPAQPPAMLVPVEDTENTINQIADTQPDEEVTINTTGKESTEQGENYRLKVMVDNSYLCQYCPEKFKTYYQIKSHMVKHKHVQVYKCVVKECGASFRDLDVFLEHTTIHNDEMTYRCHQCNKSYPSLYELGVHQYTHSLYQHSSKTGPRHFQCNKCLNKYATPEALEHHMNTNSHKFPCPHCQKMFTCERFLRRHLASHGTEGLFECNVCQKTFKTDHYLKNHSLIHTGEKPFECEECGATFNRKDKLKRHNLIHDKRIRYKCPFKTVSGCEKEFSRPDKLKAHIITHSGVKPYKCQICGKDFARKPQMKEHERGHKSDYTYKCEKCQRGFFRPKLFKDHKCQNANGQLIKRRQFMPRKIKRKPGRPRKVVTKKREDTSSPTAIFNTGIKGKIVIQNTIDGHVQSVITKEGSDVVVKTDVVLEGENLPREINEEIDNDVDTDRTMMDDTNPVEVIIQNVPIEPPVNYQEKTEDKSVFREDSGKTRKIKQECYVKAPPTPNLVRAPMVEQYVTVHLTSQGELNEIQAQLIPAGDLTGQLQLSGLQGGQVQLSSASGSTYHPIQIIETQPMTLTVSQNDQLNSIQVGDNNVMEIPVDIVTVSDEQTLVCTQEMTNSGDASGQTYSEISDYGSVEDDTVLHGSENLINGTVEIMGSEHVTGMTSLDVGDTTV